MRDTEGDPCAVFRFAWPTKPLWDSTETFSGYRSPSDSGLNVHQVTRASAVQPRCPCVAADRHLTFRLGSRRRLSCADSSLALARMASSADRTMDALDEATENVAAVPSDVVIAASVLADAASTATQQATETAAARGEAEDATKQPRGIPSQLAPPRPSAAASPSPAPHEPTTDGEPCACCSVGLPMMYQAGPSGWLRNKPGSSGIHAKHCLCLYLCLCFCYVYVYVYVHVLVYICASLCLCVATSMCVCVCVSQSVSLCGVYIGQSLLRCLSLSILLLLTSSVGLMAVVHRCESNREESCRTYRSYAGNGRDDLGK